MKPAPLGWHQDSGRVNIEIESSPRPRLSIKVVYWLSDCSETGRGNFYVIPGSHLWDKLERPEDGSLPEGQRLSVVNRGMRFSSTAVYGMPAAKTIPTSRVKDSFTDTATVGYAARMDMTIPQEMFDRNDPIRQQLLGGGTNANGHFSPKDADVPLKTWLEEQGVISSVTARFCSLNLHSNLLDTYKKIAYNFINRIYVIFLQNLTYSRADWHPFPVTGRMHQL